MKVANLLLPMFAASGSTLLVIIYILHSSTSLTVREREETTTYNYNLTSKLDADLGSDETTASKFSNIDVIGEVKSDLQC